MKFIAGRMLLMVLKRKLPSKAVETAYSRVTNENWLYVRCNQLH